MAYNTKKLFNQALHVIRERNLFFLEDVIAYLPCGRSAFYAKFPANSNEMDTIKKELETNKVETKSAIRHRLYDMDNPTAQIALYRMIATPEERDALSMTRTDITSGGKELTREPITVEVIDSRAAVAAEGGAEEEAVLRETGRR